MDFTQTLISILVILSLGLPGFVLKKLKLLNDQASKNIAVLTLFICQPAIVVVSFQKVLFSEKMLINILLTFIISLITLVAIAIITFYALKPFMKDKVKKRIITLSSTFGNSIFMGFPIISMLMPDESVVFVYLSIFAIAFNILTWTLGAYMLSNDKKYLSIKNVFLNPPTFVALIMLPLFFLNIRFDEKVIQGVGYLADMAVPLAMTVFGIRLTEVNFKNLFTDKSAYLTSLIKLVISPLLIYVGLLALPIDDVLKLTLYILFMMPTANTIVLFAEKFDTNPAAASKTVLLTTLLSCISIPLLLLLSF